MQVYPAGLVVVFVWLICIARDRYLGVMLVGVLLPFGMLNVFRLGGFSFIADDLIAALSFGTIAVHLLIYRPSNLKVPVAGLFLILLAIYGAFSTFILVRVFAGAIDVFAFNRLYDGMRVSPYFSGTILPLQPGYANISQYAYLLLDIGVFFLLFATACTKGEQFLVKGLRIGAVLNISLGLIDLAGGDALLSIVKTADYALLDGNEVSGITRIIGGFSEASAYGARSATFGAFFLVLGILGGSRRDTYLGLFSLTLALFALSTSGIIGVFVALTFLTINQFPKLLAQFSEPALYRSILGFLVVLSVAFFGLMYLFSDPQNPLYEIADRLLFSKSESRSGMERAAMALNGFEVFIATGGLGAGVGSVLANGHLSAILGAVGLPGLILISTFYFLAFFGPSHAKSQRRRACRRASQCYFFTSISIALVSSFSVSPGLSTMYIAAISLAVMNDQRIGSPKAVEVIAQPQDLYTDPHIMGKPV